MSAMSVPDVLKSANLQMAAEALFGCEPVEVDAAVFLGEEARLAVVAALDQVQLDSGRYLAGAARHGRESLRER